jgi:hypothetical protein
LVKVIETNLSLQVNNEIIDHQSRVIEVDNWKEYIDEIREAKTVIRKSAIGYMEGSSIPRNAEIEDLVFDEFHLSCTIYNYHNHGIKTKKLAYLVDNNM